MVEACCSMPLHLFLGPVGGGFEAFCSMPQPTENCFGAFGGGKYRTKISIPSLCHHLSEIESTLVLKWCICE